MNELVDINIEVGKVTEAKSVLEETKVKKAAKQEIQRRKVSRSKRRWGLLPSSLYRWTTEKRTINLKTVNQKVSHAEGRTNTLENYLMVG